VGPGRIPSASLLAAACAIAPAAHAGTASRPSCAKSARAEASAIPAPLRITTSCAAYTVFPDGRIGVAPRPRPPSGISWMAIAGANAPVVQRGGRIAVLRNGREIWRSTGRFRAVGVFASLGPRAIAFSYESYDRRQSHVGLYVAPLGGREREVARDERPLGWTPNGELLSWRFRQGFFGVYLRDRDGALIRRVGARFREVRFEPERGSVLALTRSGLVERFDGRRWRRLTDLHALGFGRHGSFEPLAGGLIGVVDGRRVAVLRADGSVFAIAGFPARRTRFSVAGNSGLVANGSGTAVAFAVTSGNSGYGGVGRESVYVLRSGDSRPREVHGGRIRFAVCERWASLSWRGEWLLYATTEGRTIALDSRSPRRKVDLTRLVHRLASLDADRKINGQVEWAR
jgi:hypothetical protein